MKTQSCNLNLPLALLASLYSLVHNIGFLYPIVTYKLVFNSLRLLQLFTIITYVQRVYHVVCSNFVGKNYKWLD